MESLPSISGVVTCTPVGVVAGVVVGAVAGVAWDHYVK